VYVDGVEPKAGARSRRAAGRDEMQALNGGRQSYCFIENTIRRANKKTMRTMVLQ
jgi:hypothetical protein